MISFRYKDVNFRNHLHQLQSIGFDNFFAENANLHGIMSLISQISHPEITALVNSISTNNHEIISHPNSVNIIGGNHGLRFQPKSCFRDFSECLLLNSSYLTPSLINSSKIVSDDSGEIVGKLHLILEVSSLEDGQPRGYHIEPVFEYGEFARIVSSIIDPAVRDAGGAIMKELFPEVKPTPPPRCPTELSFCPERNDPKTGLKNLLLICDQNNIDKSFSDIMTKQLGLSTQFCKKIASIEFNLNKNQCERAISMISNLEYSMLCGEFPTLGIHVGTNSCGQFALDFLSFVTGENFSNKYLPMTDIVQLLCSISDDIKLNTDPAASTKEFLTLLKNEAMVKSISGEDFFDEFSKIDKSPSLTTTQNPSRSSFHCQYSEFGQLPNDDNGFLEFSVALLEAFKVRQENHLMILNDKIEYQYFLHKIE